jgi:hypothetical protein
VLARLVKAGLDAPSGQASSDDNKA